MSDNINSSSIYIEEIREARQITIPVRCAQFLVIENLSTENDVYYSTGEGKITLPMASSIQGEVAATFPHQYYADVRSPINLDLKFEFELGSTPFVQVRYTKTSIKNVNSL